MVEFVKLEAFRRIKKKKIRGQERMYQDTVQTYSYSSNRVIKYPHMPGLRTLCIRGFYRTFTFGNSTLLPLGERLFYIQIRLKCALEHCRIPPWRFIIHISTSKFWKNCALENKYFKPIYLSLTQCENHFKGPSLFFHESVIKVGKQLCGQGKPGRYCSKI